MQVSTPIKGGALKGRLRRFAARHGGESLLAPDASRPAGATTSVGSVTLRLTQSDLRALDALKGRAPTTISSRPGHPPSRSDLVAWGIGLMTVACEADDERTARKAAEAQSRAEEQMSIEAMLRPAKFRKELARRLARHLERNKGDAPEQS